MVELWPRHKKYPCFGRFWLDFGKPLRPEDYAGRETDETAMQLTEVMRSQHNRLRQRIGRRPLHYNDTVDTTAAE